MGGCYGGSYEYRSVCSEPAKPKWQAELKSALKNKNLEKLTSAYRLFSTDNTSGFIAEVAEIARAFF